MTDAPHRDALLSDEYLLLQKRIEEFDARLLTIKAWSVTFAAAAIGLAYQQHNRWLLFVSALSALAFWLVETVVKTYQRAHYPRILAIEAHFGADTSTKPFQIANSWRETMEAHAPPHRYRDSLFFAGVCLPHLVIMGTAALLFVIVPPMA